MASEFGEYVEKNPSISFDGTLFVFTGFVGHSGDKYHPIIEKVLKKGGQYRSKVSGITDYLIVNPSEAGESKIKVEINPLHFYGEHDSCDYTLCCLDFYLNLNGEEYHFISQSSNNCISDLLKDIEKYLSGQLITNTELCYYIPWVFGNHCIYPYSFKVKDYNTWTFRYKRNQNDTEFDFECDISKNDIISMQKQIKYQFAKIDWEALGKSELYTFDFAETEFEWCYSANDFKKTLNKLCVGHSIKKIYVSATNYFEPLQVDENYVNYFMGSELIIQFDDFLIGRKGSLW